MEIKKLKIGKPYFIIAIEENDLILLEFDNIKDLELSMSNEEVRRGEEGKPSRIIYDSIYKNN